MLNISNVPLGMLVANSFVPSGDLASGRTGPLSNSRNDGAAAFASSGTANKAVSARTGSHRRRRVGLRIDLCMMQLRYR
jgi:hypothetical protein